MSELICTKVVKKAFKKYGFISILEFGPEGSGKTSHALHIAREVYGDWDTALRYLYFEPLSALLDIKKATDKGYRIPFMILDDAGMWLSKYSWYEDPVKMFTNAFNAIRTAVAGVSFTSPTDEVVRALREKLWLRVHVKPLTESIIQSEGLEELINELDIDWRNEAWSIGRIYRLEILPSFMRVVYKWAFDIFRTHYPIHDEYMEIRRRYFSKYVSQVYEAYKGAEGLNIRKDIPKLVAWYLSEVVGMRKEEIAKLLNVGRVTVWRWVKEVKRRWGKDIEELAAERRLPKAVK